MYPKKLLNVLQEFGLTDKESRVYLAMLSLGEANVQKIARAAEVKRPTVYTLLEALKQKGLVSIEVRGFKSFYKAADPSRLEQVFDQRRQHLMSALPDFSALYQTAGETGVIKFYEGLESVKTVYESNLRDIKPHEPYRVIANMDDWISLDPKYFESFTYRRGQLPIDIKLLLIDSPVSRRFKKRERYYNEEIRFLSKKTAIATNIVITPQRLFMHQLKPPISGIVIENKSAIKTHMELFETLWQSATTPMVTVQ